MSSSPEVARDGHSFSSSYSHQNGELSTVYNGTTTDKISSVHENPFFKHYGRKQSMPSYHSSKDKKDSMGDGAFITNDYGTEDDIGEYHPGSGFVNKLRNRFITLNAKEKTSFHTRMKRSSSLEDITGSETSNGNTILSTGSGFHDSKSVVENKPFSSLSSFHKARSIEHLPQADRRLSHHNNLAKKWNKENTSVPKSPRDSCMTAPDVDFARDDIIIIETTPSVVSKNDEDIESESLSPKSRTTSYKEEMIPDELPKPNTVVNVRSLFESASLISKANAFIKKSRPEPLKILDRSFDSPLTVVSVSSPPSESSRTMSITSPRILNYDTHQNSILSPSSTSSISPLFSPRIIETSQPSPRKEKDTNTSPPTDNAFFQKAASPQDIINNVQSLSPASRSFMDGIKPSIPVRPSPSPRNTASVKPTFASKPDASFKPSPVPFPAPASAATSYKKSSPVMPVAPFKDKGDDKKDDGLPVMIFDKSKIKPANKQSLRTKDYTSLDSEIIQKEVISGDKKISVTSIGVKGSTKRPAPDIPRNNDISNNKQLSDSAYKDTEKSQLPFIKNLKVINDHKSLISPREDPKNSDTVSDKKEIVLERITQPVRPARRNQKKEEFDTEIAQNNIRPSKPVSTTISVSSGGSKPIDHKPQSMIYLGSSEASESDDTPPVTPRRTSDTNTEPIKGIPSIIAQRLRKEKSDPSQASSLTRPSSLIERQQKTNSVENESSSSESEPFSPRKMLSKTPSSQKEDENKEDLSNSIQNEILAVRKRMEGNRTKSPGVAQIFDSSQLTKKRKENQRQRSTFSPQAQGIVPLLDLSSITDEEKKQYMPQQKEIKPCNIVFIGENIKTGRNLLKKQRKVKVHIQFRNSLSDTFEYPREEDALEQYLCEHPNEPAEEEVVNLSGLGSGIGESSDDIDEEPPTPRETMDDDTLKSNTSLSSSSNLQSYRSRYQEDFVFGASMYDPEPPPKIAKSDEPEEEDMMLRPADEDVVDIWSTNNSSDLLF